MPNSLYKPRSRIRIIRILFFEKYARILTYFIFSYVNKNKIRYYVFEANVNNDVTYSMARRFQHYVRHTRMITKIYNTRIIRVFYFLKNTHVFLRILFFHTRILEP